MQGGGEQASLRAAAGRGLSSISRRVPIGPMQRRGGSQSCNPDRIRDGAAGDRAWAALHFLYCMRGPAGRMGGGGGGGEDK